MSRAPRISVGVPFHDEERWLGQAVRSILRQSQDDVEVLLVVDGSTDRSLEIARGFSDPRVVVVSDGMRKHLPARLNEIARRARGELVARMDADDVSHPERLARELALLDARPELDAVGTWIGLVDAAGRPLAVTEGSVDRPPGSVLEKGLFSHATMLARRAWLLANPYDETLTRAEDRDLWCRTASSSRFAIVPEVLYVVRTRIGPDFLADYLLSHAQNRALFLRYGPAALGWAGTARAWLGSVSRSIAMRGAVAAGLADRLLRRRGRPPTAGEVAAIEAALAHSA